jgi:hypothetical protein
VNQGISYKVLFFALNHDPGRNQEPQPALRAPFSLARRRAGDEVKVPPTRDSGGEDSYSTIINIVKTSQAYRKYDYPFKWNLRL